MEPTRREKWMSLVAITMGALFATTACVGREDEVGASSAALSVAGESTPVRWDLDPWLPPEGDSVSRLALPTLTQPYYNMVVDVHSTTSARDLELIFSTAGNYHSALRRLLDEEYFPAQPSTLTSHLITTSPPFSLAQMRTGIVKVGNVMYVDAAPHVVAGPAAYLNLLDAEGFLTGSRIPIIRSYGNVILKRRGDDTIHTFWDLGGIDSGEFASADPAEGGSYNNYRTSVYDIALNNPRRPGMTPEQVAEDAAELQEELFDEEGVITIGPPMHRSVPHLIASGEARAGLIFLHLAVTAMRENPGVFTAVYLSPEGGETDDPDVLALGQTPLVGNRVAVLQLSRTTTPASAAQEAAREQLIAELQSAEFTQILSDTGLRRP